MNFPWLAELQNWKRFKRAIRKSRMLKINRFETYFECIIESLLRKRCCVQIRVVYSPRMRRSRRLSLPSREREREKKGTITGCQFMKGYQLLRVILFHALLSTKHPSSSVLPPMRRKENRGSPPIQSVDKASGKRRLLTSRSASSSSPRFKERM